MLALEHAPELRVSGRLDDVLADADSGNATGATQSTGRRRPLHWRRLLRRLRSAPACSVPSSAVSGRRAVAPTTVAVLMLLPLSAFEATAALPAAAVQLARSRLAARRLRDLRAGRRRRRRPTVPPVSLEPGARLAVTGPSGAGKTTLMMAVARRDPRTQRSSPRTHTCSPPPCETTFWWPAAMQPTMSCATRWGAWAWAGGSIRCPTGWPPCSSAALPPSRQASAGDSCLPALWFRLRRPCCSTSRPNTSTPRTAGGSSPNCSLPTVFSPPTAPSSSPPTTCPTTWLSHRQSPLASNLSDMSEPPSTPPPPQRRVSRRISSCARRPYRGYAAATEPRTASASPHWCPAIVGLVFSGAWSAASCSAS